jgi:4-amino-4-deoxy-L-arabinose transferase-like glycosyltransferase
VRFARILGVGGLTGFDRPGARLLGVVLFVALAVRLGAIAATPDLALTADPSDYDRHARSIAAGAGYPESGVAPAGGPTAIRPPGFPAFVAGIYALSGDSVTAARVGQALVGTVLVGLIALIAWKLYGRTEALVAGALAAVFPPLVIGGMTLLSEPLFVTLMLAAVLAALHWRDCPATRWVIVSGALAGAAVLTRSTGLLLLIPLAFAVRLGPWRRWSGYRAPALLVASALLVVVPWTIRNAVETDAFVLVSDQDGYTLAGTYNETSRKRDGFWLPANADPAYARVLEENRDLGEVDLGSRLSSKAREFALDHPGYLPIVALHNTLRLFNLGGADYERTVAQFDYGLGPNWATLMTWGLFPFLALALAGAASPAARRTPLWFWAVPVLMLSTVMVLATNRFRAPIDPFILVLAALGLVWLARRRGYAAVGAGVPGRRVLRR